MVDRLSGMQIYNKCKKKLQMYEISYYYERCENNEG